MNNLPQPNDTEPLPAPLSCCHLLLSRFSISTCRITTCIHKIRHVDDKATHIVLIVVRDPKPEPATQHSAMAK